MPDLHVIYHAVHVLENHRLIFYSISTLDLLQNKSPTTYNKYQRDVEHRWTAVTCTWLDNLSVGSNKPTHKQYVHISTPILFASNV